MDKVLSNVFNNKVCEVNSSYLTSQLIPEKEIALRSDIYSFYNTSPIYVGNGFIKLVNLFMTSLTNEKSVIHSSKVFELKELASSLVASGNLSGVHILYNGRVSGEDRKGTLIYRYDNAKVPASYTKTYKITFSRSKYGIIGGTITVKFPFNPLSHPRY